jgi:glycosyltransferase involved in cell wall biosynthesis
VNSQFIDRPRKAVREALKRFYFLPYNGALAAGARSKAYVEFLGMRGRATGACNTLGVRRIRELAGVFAPKTEPGDGGFITVARFVPEKNLGMLLEAYAGYRKEAEHPRGLSLYGGGPLEAELRSHASALGIGAHVQFFPFLQRDEIAKAMANSVGLILPSIMEPFGNVVIEAQAVGRSGRRPDQWPHVCPRLSRSPHNLHGRAP